MPMNFPVYRPFEPQAFAGIRPTSSDWGPKDMSQQLQKGIGSLYENYRSAYGERQSADARERLAAAQREGYGGQAAALAAPGGPYATGTTGATGATNPATATNPRSIPSFTALPNKGVAENFQSLFDQNEQQYALPPGTLGSLAFIESKFNPGAKNPKSSAGGMFQQIDSNWKQYGQGDRYDPAASTAAAARFAADNARTLQRALGRQPTVGELYLAHQQGPGGALKLLSNPGARAADMVGAKAVRLNGGNMDMSAADFANLWTKKADSVWQSLYGGKQQAAAAPGAPAAAPGAPPIDLTAFPQGQTFIQPRVEGAPPVMDPTATGALPQPSQPPAPPPNPTPATQASQPLFAPPGGAPPVGGAQPPGQAPPPAPPPMSGPSTVAATPPEPQPPPGGTPPLLPPKPPAMAVPPGGNVAPGSRIMQMPPGSEGPETFAAPPPQQQPPPPVQPPQPTPAVGPPPAPPSPGLGGGAGPQTTGALPQVYPTAAPISARHRNMMADAILSRDPNLIKLTQDQIEQESGRGSAKDWSVMSLGDGRALRINQVTGQREIIDASGGVNQYDYKPAEGGRLWQIHKQGLEPPKLIGSGNANVEYKTGKDGTLWEITKDGSAPPKLIDPNAGKGGEPPVFTGNSVEAQALNGLVASGTITRDQAYQLGTGKSIQTQDGTFFLRGSELVGVGVDGKPISGPQAGVQIGPAKVKDLDPAVAQRIGMGNRFMDENLPNIRKWLDEGGLTPQARLGIATGRGLGGDMSRMVESGREALLRGLTGAGMGIQEAQEYAQRYALGSTDSETDIRRKLNNLEGDLKATRDAALAGRNIKSEELTGKQQPNDKSKMPKVTSDEDYDKQIAAKTLKSGMSFVDPEGNVRKVP
jgi:hypothetical protein